MNESALCDGEMVLNPLTRRKIRVGSAVHKRLVKSGHLPSLSGGGDSVPACRSLKQRRQPNHEDTRDLDEQNTDIDQHPLTELASDLDNDPFYDKKTRDLAKAKGLSPDIEALVDMIIAIVIDNRKTIGDMDIGGKTVAEALKRAIIDG